MKTIVNKKQLTDKVENCLQDLKGKYYGIDDQLERITKLVQSFLVNPKLHKNPFVINCWGPTGTGKTEPITQFLQALEVNFCYFDMGQYAKEPRKFFENLEEAYNAKSDGPTIFVFDEFQFLRTKDENGKETMDPSSRAIWELLDKGSVYSGSLASWRQEKAKQIVSKKIFMLTDADIKVTGNTFTEIKIGDEGPEEKETSLLTTFDLINLAQAAPKYFEETIPEAKNFIKLVTQPWYESYGITKSDPEHQFHNIFATLEISKSNEELIAWLSGFEKNYDSPQEVYQFNPLMVIIIGNLDEAYGNLANNMTGADFVEKMNKASKFVSLADIKSALTKRFRAEQIGRLGHNHVIYPTLNESAFRTIIKKNILDLLSFYSEEAECELVITQELEDLLYDEIVTPTQGARALSSGIKGLLSEPLINIINYFDSTFGRKLTIGIEWNPINRDCYLTCHEEDVKYEIEAPLRLQTKARNSDYIDPTTFKRVCIHEAGHAVIYNVVTGNIPISISVKSSMANGGFVAFSGEEEDNIENNEKLIMATLAGPLSEREFLGYHCLSGASMDHQAVTSAVYKTLKNNLLKNPLIISNKAWNDDASRLSGNLLGWSSIVLDLKALWLAHKLKRKTRSLIRQHRGTILELALKLEKNLSMSKKELEEYFKS